MLFYTSATRPNLRDESQHFHALQPVQIRMVKNRSSLGLLQNTQGKALGSVTEFLRHSLCSYRWIPPILFRVTRSAEFHVKPRAQIGYHYALLLCDAAFTGTLAKMKNVILRGFSTHAFLWLTSFWSVFWVRNEPLSLQTDRKNS
jgi:hypothetical protein